MPESFSCPFACFAFLLRRNHQSRIAAATRAKAPRTPPTIAPTGVPEPREDPTWVAALSSTDAGEEDADGPGKGIMDSEGSGEEEDDADSLGKGGLPVGRTTHGGGPTQSLGLPVG